MALKFYEAYSNSIAKEPVDSWRELMQETINDGWENTSTIEKVEGQSFLGSKEYNEESVQLNSVLDPKTGTSLGDDYRKIIYKTLANSQITQDSNNTNRFLGKYYKFYNFTWLTINTNTIIGATASAILQRCNNVLKWYDSNNVFHEWACVVERTLSSTGFNDGSEGVSEINSDTLVKVQLNEETNLIPYNQRFLLNGHAFQVKQINNNVSPSYMELYLFGTQIQSNDDIVNNIANSVGKTTTTINETKILPEISKILQGDSQTFSIYKYDNGMETADTFEISTQGPIAGVNYILKIIDGNNFEIENLLQSNVPLTINCVNMETFEVVSKTILLGGGW